MKKFLQKPFKYSLTKNILLIIGILVVGYVIINLFLRIITRHNQELTVPDMTGMNLAEASAVAAEADLRLEVTDSVYIRGMERGAIARQNPEPGGKVKKNRRILLVINSVIPRQSTMPSLTGFSLRQARTELASNGLNIGKLIYVNDMATDNVLAQQYMGETRYKAQQRHRHRPGAGPQPGRQRHVHTVHHRLPLPDGHRAAA